MVGCRNCARTVIVLAVLAPILSLVVLGVQHNKAYGQNNNNKQTDGKSAHLVVNHVKKQSNVITDSHGSLLFDPPLLDFGDCAMSVVWRQKVNIKNNRMDEKPINILSISGSSLHFHCSFVADKILEPAANTSFEVVFLSREEGYVEDTLYIHTSRGAFPYRVQARGMPNPFMVKPFVNVRIPVNTTFSPLIHMYNPFASALQVLEMFGSSCDLHLEMPVSGEKEPNNDSLDWWIIPPHQSKAIAKVNFLAMRAMNVTAFVRIRTNYTAHPHGSLMLPVSLEVTSQPLLFCPQQYLDFGVVEASDPAKTLKLFIINSGNRPITVQSVVASPASEGLSIDFSPVKVPPSLTTPTLIALVTFRPSRVNQLRTISGRILVQSKSGQFKASVGYQVTVAASYLHYNRSSTQFLASHHLHLPSCQPLSVSNEFALPVDVEEAVLDAQEYIQARNFSNRVLRTREQGTILMLCLVKMPPLLDSPFVTSLHLRTNASAGLDIPVSVFTGRVVPIWNDFIKLAEEDPDDGLNNSTDHSIGWLTEGSSKELYLAIWNPNPIGVSLQGWGTNCSNAIITYLGSENGSPTQFKARSHYANLTMATTLRPESYAVFQVQVQMPRDNEEEEEKPVDRCAGPSPTALAVHVRTIFETVAINLHYRTVPGAIRTIPAPLPWSANFLDPFLTTEVRLNSTLKESVTVVGFQAAHPFHHKLNFDLYNGNTTSVVQGMQSAGVARLAYPLDWDCATSARTQLVSEWQLGQHRWWNAFSDLDLTTSLYNCYESLVQSVWQQISSVKLVTKEIGFTEMPLRLDVQWPRLALKRRLHFPLTEMGRSSRVDLKLANPTASVVLAQILWLEDAQVELKELVSKLPLHLTEGIELPSFSGSKKKSSQHHQPRPAFSLVEAEEQDSTSPPSHDSVMVYLTPGSQAQLSVTFSPTSDMKYRSLLVIKNNVTGLELVSLSGQGQSAKFLLANRKPGSNQPLLFDISEQHLKNCEGSGSNGGGVGGWHSRFQYLVPSVTVKRTFTARNRGQFPITITGFDINHSPCEGFGFRVLQCHPITLLPNQSHSLEVAFTPDFTQTRVHRTLRLHSTVGGQDTPLNFTLMATLPTHMLVLCAAVLPRPNWELFFYYGSVVTSVFLLLCVVTAATLEADRILKSGILAMVTVVSPSGSGIEYSAATAGHLLDLKAVVRETSPPVAQQTLASPAVSTEPSKASRGKKANSKTTNKKMKSPISTSLPQQSNKQAAPPAWISSPLTSLSTPTAKRSTTPSPTMSQRSQSPPPAPPSPAPPPLKVITTKEETRVFKLKPKKTKASKTVSNSSSEEVKPKKEVVAAQQHQGKRARSSSVSSNDRNKNSAPAQKTSKPNAENTPVPPPSPPSPKETTSTESKSIIWQPRPDNKTLAKTTTATTATNRPQPPVGKILPEVRKPLSTNLESTNTVLPKPIGYRQHAPLEKKPSPGWNSTNSSSSWFGLSSLPSAGAWYPENGSLFSRPIQQLQPSAQEPSRDWFGLRSLASELTAPNSGASSANMDQSTWPVTPFPVDPPSTGTGNLWPEIQPISSGNPVNPAVGSRVYSPWSVPHWLNVTQRQPERQEPATGQGDQLGVLASGIWDAPSPRAPNNNNQDSWNSDYSQF